MFESSLFLTGYRACLLAVNHSFTLLQVYFQNLHHCVKVCAVMYWLKKWTHWCTKQWKI